MARGPAAARRPAVPPISAAEVLSLWPASLRGRVVVTVSVTDDGAVAVVARLAGDPGRPGA